MSELSDYCAPANAAWRARLAKFNPAHGPWDGAVDTTCRLPRNWDTMTLDALWSALNAPRRHPTPQSTIDALAIKRRTKKLPDAVVSSIGQKKKANENDRTRRHTQHNNSSEAWTDWPAAQTCEACGATFMPRSQSGGKPQRYCSPECRKSPKATGNPIEQDATPTVAPEPPKKDGEVVDFDWSDPRLTTIEEQPQTAIYINASGSLVIRQWRYPEDDAIAIITRSALDDFLEKVTDVGGIPSFGRSE
jgi:hypothetical protein